MTKSIATFNHWVLAKKKYNLFIAESFALLEHSGLGAEDSTGCFCVPVF